MPGSGNSEIYFIAIMMILILAISFAATFFFVRQYRKEMRADAARRAEAAGREPEAD